MGKRWKIGLALGAVALAGTWRLMTSHDHFDLAVGRNVLARLDREDCRAGRDTGGTVVVPEGARLTIVEVDWAGKNWPCFKATYKGTTIFLTSDQFTKL